MSEQAFFWLIGGFAAIVAAIAGALWKHVLEDAKTRERLATLEAEAEQTKEEIKSLRQRWHDLRDGTLKDVWHMMQDRYEALRVEILRLIGK